MQSDFKKLVTVIAVIVIIIGISYLLISLFGWDITFVTHSKMGRWLCLIIATIMLYIFSESDNYK